MSKYTFIISFLSAVFFFQGLAYGTEFNFAVPIMENETLAYNVDGEIDGYGKTNFMVDTGAGYTAINESTAKILVEAGKAEFKGHVYATLANGEEIELRVYDVASINIGGSCTVHNVNAVVLPGNTRNILGLSALKKTAPFGLSVDPPQLMMSKCESSNV